MKTPLNGILKKKFRNIFKIGIYAFRELIINNLIIYKNLTIKNGKRELIKRNREPNKTSLS